MVDRNLHSVDEILYSEHLNCHPAENQAAKIFVKWLKEHPEYDESDVNMRIDSREWEEDYYGNGGGLDQYVKIFKEHEETEDEYKKRIKKEESDVLNDFEKDVRRSISSLIFELNIYPYATGGDISTKTDEIMNTINSDVAKILDLKMRLKLDLRNLKNI